MKQPHRTLICKRLPKNIAAITLFPFIIYKTASYADDPILVHHERIHLKQQLELLILPFYLWYGLEFLIRLSALKDKRKAYRAISFEREAYANESNLLYAKQRKAYSFLKYMFKNP
ncbi:hypothetical protein [Myroides fluvii]|uniref:hypothetical protein n=1 Tax=Myroides fluvii TaxID=2572594 RepID=UPI00131A9C51|nr:hypothetical protein [Myroides fluvii]